MKEKLHEERFLVNHHVSAGDIARVKENVTVPASVQQFIKASADAERVKSKSDTSKK